MTLWLFNLTNPQFTAKSVYHADPTMLAFKTAFSISSFLGVVFLAEYNPLLTAMSVSGLIVFSAGGILVAKRYHFSL